MQADKLTWTLSDSRTRCDQAGIGLRDMPRGYNKNPSFQGLFLVGSLGLGGRILVVPASMRPCFVACNAGLSFLAQEKLVHQEKTKTSIGMDKLTKRQKVATYPRPGRQEASQYRAPCRSTL